CRELRQRGIATIVSELLLGRWLRFRWRLGLRLGRLLRLRLDITLFCRDVDEPHFRTTVRRGVLAFGLIGRLVLAAGAKLILHALGGSLRFQYRSTSRLLLAGHVYLDQLADFQTLNSGRETPQALVLTLHLGELVGGILDLFAV